MYTVMHHMIPFCGLLLILLTSHAILSFAGLVHFPTLHFNADRIRVKFMSVSSITRSGCIFPCWFKRLCAAVIAEIVCIHHSSFASYRDVQDSIQRRFHFPFLLSTTAKKGQGLYPGIGRIWRPIGHRNRL